MLGISIRCIQHSQAMIERGVCELAHSFFHYSFFFSFLVMLMFVVFVEFLQASELLQELDSVTFDMNSKVQPQLENMTKNIYYSE